MFFTRNSKIDFLVFLSPVAFVIQVVNFFIWGDEFYVIVLLCFSFANLFLNVRSLLRLRARLFVDNYSIVFTLFNLLFLGFAVFFVVKLIVYRPVYYSPDDYNVQIENIVLSGSMQDGFEIKEELFKGGIECGLVKKYSPIEKTDSKFEYEPVLLFVSSAIGPILHYEPYFLMLSQRGYTVYAADFNPRDEKYFDDWRDLSVFKKQAVTREYFNDKEKYNEIREKEIVNITQKYKQLSKIICQLEGENIKFFYITDGIGYDSINDVIEEYAQNAVGFFSMNTIKEYKSQGFGFVDMTQLITAQKLGLERDNSFFIPRYVAKKTCEDMEKLLPLKLEPIEKSEEIEEGAEG